MEVFFFFFFFLLIVLSAIVLLHLPFNCHSVLLVDPAPTPKDFLMLLSVIKHLRNDATAQTHS